MTLTKFFNDAREEVPAEEATTAVRLTLDSDDNLVKSETFFVSEKKPSKKSRIAEVIAARGGEGSGNFGHGGRPGEVGGSSDEGGASPEKGSGSNRFSAEGFISVSGHSPSQLKEMKSKEILASSRQLTVEEIKTDFNNMNIAFRPEAVPLSVAQEIHASFMQSYIPYASKATLSALRVMPPVASELYGDSNFVLNNSYANYSSAIGGARIILNEKYFGNPEKLTESLDSNKGYHPLGCNTAKSMVDHEIAHSLTYGIEKGGSRWNPIKEFYEKSGAREVSKGLSKYASKGIEEFVAEAWSEYHNSESPRPMAIKTTEMVMSLKGLK